MSALLSTRGCTEIFPAAELIMKMISVLRGAGRTKAWRGSISLDYSPRIRALGKSKVLRSGKQCEVELELFKDLP